MFTEEIIQKDSGVCTNLERVIMNKGTYPSGKNLKRKVCLPGLFFAEVAQPGTARAWKSRDALRLRGSNLPSACYYKDESQKLKEES